MPEITFEFRKLTTRESENWNNKCSMTLENGMRCPRQATRYLGPELLCEGHFQIARQTGIAAGDIFIDQDEEKEKLSGKSEPLEH